MPKQTVTEAVTRLAVPLAEALGLELVEVEFIREGGQRILRVLIDREGGVTLDDCEAMSRVLGEELDRLDPIPSSYHLEVSSPGIERPLKKEADFLRFAGRVARIRLYVPQDGRKQFTGMLRGLEGQDILLDDGSGQLVRIPLSRVAKANLLFT